MSDINHKINDLVDIVKKKISSKKFIKLINLNKNYGQQIAIYVALKNEKADFFL